MHLRIALLQLLPGGSLAEQLEIGTAACRKAKALGADIALFPEMWSCGYRIPQEKQALDALAISGDGEFVRAFRDLAAALQMAVGITFLEQHDPKPLNSMVLFDRRGRRVLHRLGVLVFDFGGIKIGLYR